MVDIGIPSWSHPADRISATLFIFQQTCKYAFMRCGGEWGRALKAFMVLSWVSGLWAFKRSGLACRERKLCRVSRGNASSGVNATLPGTAPPKAPPSLTEGGFPPARGGS